MKDWAVINDQLTATSSSSVLTTKLVDIILRLPACHELSRDDALMLIFSQAREVPVPPARSGKLADGQNSDLLEAAVSLLCNQIESLPRPYVFVMPLPEYPALGPAKIALADGVDLVFNAPGPVAGLLSLLERTTAYNAEVHVRLAGYAFMSSRTATLLQAHAILKRVAFLLRAHRRGSAVFGFQKNLKMWTRDEQSKLSTSYSPPHALEHMYSRLRIDLTGLEIDGAAHGSAPTFLGRPRRPASTPEEQIKALNLEFSTLKERLAAASDADLQNAFTAAEWYVDSVGTDDLTLAYLMACIGIEAVFGEKDMKEMTARLGDRYAFMFGRRATDRAQLKKRFEDVFATRGSLVHARRPRLTGRELDLLFAAQSILEMSIQRELRLTS